MCCGLKYLVDHVVLIDKKLFWVKSKEFSQLLIVNCKGSGESSKKMKLVVKHGAAVDPESGMEVGWIVCGLDKTFFISAFFCRTHVTLLPTKEKNTLLPFHW